MRNPAIPNQETAFLTIMMMDDSKDAKKPTEE